MGGGAISVGIWSPNGSAVANGIDEGVGDGSFGWRAGDGVGDPAVYGTIHGENEDEEEAGEVAGSKAVSRHKYDEANDCDGDGIDKEPEATVQTIRGEIMSKRVHDHEYIRRGNEEEGDDVGVTESFRESWKEVLEASSTCLTEVGKGKDICFGIAHGEFETLQLGDYASFIYISFGGFDSQTTVGNMFHLW